MFSADQIARLDELKEILKSFSEGATFDEIYKKGVNFSEEKELSFCLSKAIKMGICFKKENRYILTVNPHSENADLDPVTREIKDLIHKVVPKEKLSLQTEETNEDSSLSENTVSNTEPPSVKVLETRRTEVKPLTATTGVITEKKEKQPLNSKVTGMLRGNFRRDSAVGKVAFAYYFFREFNSFGLDRILEITGLNKNQKQAVYQANFALNRDGYIQKSGSGYKWTNKFSYPFSTILSDDELLIVKTPLEFRKTSVLSETETVTQTTVKNVVEDKVTPHISNVVPLSEKKFDVPTFNNLSPEHLNTDKTSHNVSCESVKQNVSNKELTILLIQERQRCLMAELESLKRMEDLLLGKAA